MTAPLKTEPTAIAGEGIRGSHPSSTNAQSGTETSLMQPAAAASVYPARADTKTPQRVSKTAKDLYRAMGVRSTSKHKPAALKKMAQGLYEHHSGVVVTRTHQDVNVYAHEIGHAIFERAGVYDKQGNPTAAFKADIDAMVQALPAAFNTLYKPNELARIKTALPRRSLPRVGCRPARILPGFFIE